MSQIPYFYLESVVSISVPIFDEKGTEIMYCIGSGFLLSKEFTEDRGYVCLITNRHVIENNKMIYLRFNSSDEASSKDYPVTLYNSDGSPNFSVHPNPKVDIAAINIVTDLLVREKKNFSTFRIGKHTLNLSNMKLNGLEEGSLVYALGFPLNIHDKIKTPISRLGNIAKIRHLFRDINNLSYIIDAQVFPGNSGGPVINRIEPISIQGTNSINSTNLIGIVHSYIPYVEEAKSLQTGKIRSVFEENSGLTLVHPVDFILEVHELEIERKTKLITNK